jgi:hypothetical protein
MFWIAVGRGDCVRADSRRGVGSIARVSETTFGRTLRSQAATGTPDESSPPVVGLTCPYNSPKLTNGDLFYGIVNGRCEWGKAKGAYPVRDKRGNLSRSQTISWTIV